MERVVGTKTAGREVGREIGKPDAWRAWWEEDVLAGNIVAIPAEHFQTTIGRV